MLTVKEWRPAAVTELQSHLGLFRDWTLCGGHSIDILLGLATRPHGDIDIGVLRSHLSECLRAIEAERVFLCQPGGSKIQWNGAPIDPTVHDIWITDRDRKYWCFQIMVFDDEGNEILYRRDQRIRWTKDSHSINVDGLRVLNPWITFLYRANKTTIHDKEVADICALITAPPKHALGHNYEQTTQI